MPRTARIKSLTGVYHIIMRGINRQNIFHDVEDNQKFLLTFMKYKKICGFRVFAYCLMGNHVHLLLQVGLEPLEKIMRRLCASYVFWYNWKYARIGYLFQDRFKSEPVEDDAYFLTVLRYIHQNPLRAGLVQDIGDYRWSSYCEYIQPTGFVDVDFPLNMFDTEREKAVENFVVHQCAQRNEQCLEIEEKQHYTDREAREIILRVCHVGNATDLQRQERESRNYCLKKLKEEYSLPVRQIARLTGIGRGVVFRA